MTTLTDTQVITASGGLVELGYSQIASNVTVNNATAGTGVEVIAPLTVVCDGGPVLVEFFTTALQPSNTAGDELTVSLFQDSSEKVRYWGYATSQATNNGFRPASLSYRVTPTAGSHTFSVKAFVTNAARTGVVAAGNTTTGNAPAFLRVSKIVQATQWPAVTTGTIICTSSTRPAAPFEGQTIYETDTGIRLTYRSATWVGENEVVDLVPTTGLAVSATITPAQMFGSGGKRGITTLGISNTTPTAAACYAHLGSVVNRSAEFYFLTPSSGSNILAGTGVTFRFNGGFTTNFSYNSDSAYTCVYVCNSATTGSILIN